MGIEEKSLYIYVHTYKILREESKCLLNEVIKKQILI